MIFVRSTAITELNCTQKNKCRIRNVTFSYRYFFIVNWMVEVIPNNPVALDPE
jgi:hypothetical protein